MKRNTHEGSSFDDFLKAEGMYEDVEAAAVKKVIARVLADIEKCRFARRAEAAPYWPADRQKLFGDL